MYLMHRWWARKPHNVVRQYVEHYSAQGEIVLDPFCGSGVTCAEALRVGRKTIGVDIAPVASFMTRMTVLPNDFAAFQEAYTDIEKHVREKINELYQTDCPSCRSPSTVICTRYSHDKPTTVRNFVCPRCGPKGSKKLTPKDRKELLRIESAPIPGWYPKDVRLFYSNGKPFKEKQKSNYIHDLFTHRNLIALSLLFSAILKIEDSSTKDLMLFAFSSTIVQCSKMMLWTETNRPGWKQHSYWVPADNVEMNVWDRFENRYQSIRNGIRDAEPVSVNCREGTFDEIANENKTFLVLTQSALDLKVKPAQIADESVDYVFTDPPYGGSVQYMELSTIWAAWLAGANSHRFDMKYDDELTINKSQTKDFDFYHKMLAVAFREVYRVLRKGRWLTVTFHNTETKIYNSIIKAVVLAGFDLEKIVYQPPTKRSAKQQLQPYGSAVGDYYIRFRKPITEHALASQEEIDKTRYERIVVDAVKKVIALRGDPTPYSVIINSYSEIYEELKANGYLFSAPEGIDDILKRHLDKEFVLKSNLWWFKDPNSIAFLQRVPLSERVEKAVINVLNRKVKASFDEILQEIFLNFPNALTPDISNIHTILNEYAKKTPDKKWMLKPSVKRRESEHDVMVGLLAELGEGLGFEAIADLPSKRVSKLPFECENPDRVMEIDVLWLDKGKPIYEFEVENTTGITDAVVRGTNLPNGGVRRVIVIPEERKSLLKRRLREQLIREMIEKGDWKFIYYSDVNVSYESMRRKGKHFKQEDVTSFFHAPDQVRTETQGKLDAFT
jgi:DNA modification methylase